MFRFAMRRACYWPVWDEYRLPPSGLLSVADEFEHLPSMPHKSNIKRVLKIKQ